MVLISHSYQRVTGVSRVAIIGAGFSGITSASHLVKEGLDVTVFERTGVIGGAWVYDPRIEPDPPYPNLIPPPPSWTDVEKPGLSYDEVALLHGPPTPCYAGLRNNVPTTLMRSCLLRWPEGTGEFICQSGIAQYVHDIATIQNISKKIQFHTRVESVSKPAGSSTWKVTTSRLEAEGQTPLITRQHWEFDAVVVASGHYHIPFVPDVDGLALWKSLFPNRVMHSKRYRNAHIYTDKTVLLIGAGASSFDIAKEVLQVGGKVYQSVRESKYDITASRLPKEVMRVAMTAKFLVNSQDMTDSGDLAVERPIPGKVVLQDGAVLEGMDYVVICTGYITSYPFLGDLEQPSVAWENAGDKTIITSDGYTTHNLHKDIFYIPDPTLAFIGVSALVSTFSLFDFQAKVMAKVLTGQVQLPHRSMMRQEHKQRKSKHQAGDRFHAILLGEAEYIDELLTWVNRELVQAGLRPITGMDADWLETYENHKRLRKIVPAPRK
ncbi:FAD/NAD(P)-binding domain-containing protein [Xylariaceae sp. FL0255]|nr:FAD/NAD(P)-binding domain-containing protein [Xylariaceae sp. FL0255]